MRTLLLWLEGALQSWGADSRFGNRTTLPFPTRSGVLGLLCCAAGRGGDQQAWLEHMAHYTQTVRAYARRQDGKAVLQPLLRDFHMVGSGYNTGDPWENLLVPKKSDGSKRSGSGAKVTYRQYLQDMAFACVLNVPENDAYSLAAALETPVWELSLGRRNCPPSAVIGRGVFADEPSALEAADVLAQEKNRLPVLTVRDGVHEGGDDVWVLNDVPICFGIRKRYRDRRVTLFS